MINKAIQILRKEGVKSFLRRSSFYIAERLEFLALPYALLKIKNLKQNHTLSKFVDFAFNDCAGLIKPLQVYCEVLKLLETLSKIKPKVILEIGTANGGTLFLFSRIASKDATIISIDLPGGKLGGGYPQWRKILYRSLALPSQKIYLLRGDSHKKETLKEVKNILNGRKVDFLFIDGDHTYEGVKRDFEMYSKLVERDEKVIALHDIVYHPFDPDCQVDKFWKEIKQKYRTMEIVEDRNQAGAGIGIIKWL